MYSREQIEQVRQAVDLVEVIREYVPSLKAAGRSVRGLCPFHSERTPSFHVHPEKGLFKCFGCGEGGDVIGFLSKIEQIGFSEALEKLAERGGVVLKKQSSRQEREPEGIREKLYRVLETAASLYHQQLWDERVGEEARAYLSERGVNEDSIQRFQLGVAASGGTSAFEELIKKGFPIELCQQAGLVTRSAAGRYYDPQFGRLIFPIFDSFGHVIGFGGRVLPGGKKSLLDLSPSKGDEAPKYLNSPESPVFSKGKSLYGLFQAKTEVLAKRQAVIVEGYMDVVGLHQGGVVNAVATLGTAFTRDHAKLLKRYADQVVAFFDPDEAGQKAAVRGLTPLLEEGLFPRVISTGETDDPDELIRAKGRAFLDDLIGTAPDFVDFVLNAGTKASATTLQERSVRAKELLEIVSHGTDEIVKGEWLERIARTLGLQRSSLERALHQEKGRPVSSAKESVVASEPQAFPSAEEEFLQLLLVKPSFLLETNVDEEDFFLERHRSLFVRLLKQMKETGQISLPAIYDESPTSDKEWLMRVTMEQKEFSDPEERYQQLLESFRRKKGRERLAALGDKLKRGVANLEERNEYKDLLRSMKGSVRLVS